MRYYLSTYNNKMYKQFFKIREHFFKTNSLKRNILRFDNILQHRSYCFMRELGVARALLGDEKANGIVITVLVWLRINIYEIFNMVKYKFRI